MARLVVLGALVLIAAIAVAAARAEGPQNDCTVPGDKDGNVTLAFIGETNVTIEDGNTPHQFSLSLCNRTNFTSGGFACGAGFALESTPQSIGCGTLYSHVEAPLTYNATTKLAAIEFSDGFSALLAVTIKCIAGLEGMNLRSSNISGAHTALHFESEEVCPGYTPSTAPSDDGGKLKAGAIVGIIIGVVAVVVLGIVVVQMRSRKGTGSSEASYSSV